MELVIAGKRSWLTLKATNKTRKQLFCNATPHRAQLKHLQYLQHFSTNLVFSNTSLKRSSPTLLYNGSL